MGNKVLVLTADGQISPEADKDINKIAYLQGVVGGWIEAVELNSLPFECIMWVNEEGKLNSLPINLMATALYEQSFGFGQDIIVGDVVLTGGYNDEGYTQYLTDEQITEVEKTLASAFGHQL